MRKFYSTSRTFGSWKRDIKKVKTCMLLTVKLWPDVGWLFFSFSKRIRRHS